MWVEGTIAGTYIRRTLKTRSWERAQAIIRQMEADEIPAPPVKEKLVTIEQAVTEYIADAKARGLAAVTYGKYELILHKQLLSWANSEGYKFLRA